MIERFIIYGLKSWAQSKDRKPLVLRGARQVGKTYAVREFAKKNYKNFFELNLEKVHEQRLFQAVTDAEVQLSILESYFGTKIDLTNSLLFIDEIQHSKIALQMLRYFYEQMPKLSIIVAGSLLDIFLKNSELSFPVGRVQYLYMHPVTFSEYLKTYYSKTFEELSEITLKSDIPISKHEMYLRKVQEYALIGGMPEAVVKFQERKSIVDADSTFQSLNQGFYDDINKYAKGESINYIKHVLYSIPYFVGKDITYKGFGGSNYGSREMTQAFQILEEVGLLNRIYSSRSIALPIVSNQRKRAKLIALDIGITNFVIKQRKPFLGESIIENIYKGSIAEQFVGQTLIGQESKLVFKPNYWYRDKSGSTAEVDFLIEIQGTLLPIEVKNSDEKQVRSIESFIDESRVNGINTEVCIRISANPLKINNQQTPKANRFKLINVPFYLTWKIRDGLIE